MPAEKRTPISKDQIEQLMSIVQRLYLADEIPWVIGYSGGKDSTATLQLVWLSLKELPDDSRKKPIHVINTDTLVESPIVSQWVQQSLAKMDQAAAEDNLPIITHRLTPAYNNTFWVNLIGRGYPFPRKKFRLTPSLKIRSRSMGKLYSFLVPGKQKAQIVRKLWHIMKKSVFVSC